MNSKMTTNSQLSTNEPKKINERKTTKTKTKQTTRTGTDQRNGYHMEGFQWGGGRRGTRCGRGHGGINGNGNIPQKKNKRT